jgi:chromosome segregation ATPase
MTSLHFVKKARKNYKDAGIKKGDSYYWWQFAYGSKQKSKTKPRQSQLTQSEFLGTIYDIEERLEDIKDIEDAQTEREQIVDELRTLADECEEKRSNMPEQLQDSGSGETLQNRYDSCNEFADELEAVDLEIEKEDDESEEDFEERVEGALSELQGCSYNGE